MTAEPDLLPSSIAAFTEALHGERGSLDAWLEVNDECEVRAHVEAYARANVAHATAAKDAELVELRSTIEVLTAEVADLRRKWSDAESNLAACDSDLWVFQQRAERLAEALRDAEKDLRRLSVIDCGCKPCRGACRTGRGAEWELESRLETAHAAANKARAALRDHDQEVGNG